jgi:hypothetical protein
MARGARVSADLGSHCHLCPLRGPPTTIAAQLRTFARARQSAIVQGDPTVVQPRRCGARPTGLGVAR